MSASCKGKHQTKAHTMKNEIQVLKENGFENIRLVATFESNGLDFKNMYVAKRGKFYRFIQIDNTLSSHVWSVGEPYNTMKDIMTDAYAYLKSIWGFKDKEITEEVKKAHQIAMLGFEITKEEIGAIQYAKDIFARSDQSEMAEINAYYLSKLLKKLKSLEIN